MTNDDVEMSETMYEATANGLQFVQTTYLVFLMSESQIDQVILGGFEIQTKDILQYTVCRTRLQFAAGSLKDPPSIANAEISLLIQ